MSDTKERISGKVAKILTARELVINRGERDGVEVGMRFAVLNSKGSDIIDPDSGEILDSVELPKTFVKVISVKPRLAVARTFREFVTPGVRGISDAFVGLAGRPERREVETLKTDESRLKDELEEEDSYVKTGDPVVEVSGGDNYVGLA